MLYILEINCYNHQRTTIKDDTTQEPLTTTFFAFQSLKDIKKTLGNYNN